MILVLKGWLCLESNDYLPIIERYNVWIDRIVGHFKLHYTLWLLSVCRILSCLLKKIANNLMY